MAGCGPGAAGAEEEAEEEDDEEEDEDEEEEEAAAGGIEEDAAVGRALDVRGRTMPGTDAGVGAGAGVGFCEMTRRGAVLEDLLLRTEEELEEDVGASMLGRG